MSNSSKDVFGCMSVCVCACVREGEREREQECVYVRVCACMCMCVCACPSLVLSRFHSPHVNVAPGADQRVLAGNTWRL